MYARVSSNHLNKKDVRKSDIFSWLYHSEYMKVHTPILYGSYTMLQKRKSTKKSLVSSWLTGYFVKLSASQGQITPHFPNNLPQLVFLKRFLQKKITSWRIKWKSWNFSFQPPEIRESTLKIQTAIS